VIGVGVSGKRDGHAFSPFMGEPRARDLF